MSIPTYNLYNFVAQALENRFIIKYFYPWGEKGFKNIIDHTSDNINGETYAQVFDKIGMYHKTQIKDDVSIPKLICHDQEPLDFDRYSDDELMKEIDQIHHPEYLLKFINKAKSAGFKNLNLRWIGPTYNSAQWVLLHSELNSPEVVKYQNTGLFKCAYWWSHAIIARDWYRFANYDNRLTDKSQPIKANFLVYVRATTGKRKYRKIFLNHLDHIDNVQVGSINKQPVSSTTSAEYIPEDFAQTRCSIVLETVYDQRIHLTEKTLRPIACGHPFMILNGPGALETIRSYGFKTFQPYINEDYDSEQDSEKRMNKVLIEMRRINNSSEKYQKYIWDGCAEIAAYNKKLFFDDKFLWRVKTELRRTVRSV